jgi:hypothetical protein
MTMPLLPVVFEDVLISSVNSKVYQGNELTHGFGSHRNEGLLLRCAVAPQYAQLALCYPAKVSTQERRQYHLQWRYIRLDDIRNSAYVLDGEIVVNELAIDVDFTVIITTIGIFAIEWSEVEAFANIFLRLVLGLRYVRDDLRQLKIPRNTAIEKGLNPFESRVVIFRGRHWGSKPMEQASWI